MLEMSTKKPMSVGAQTSILYFLVSERRAASFVCDMANPLKGEVIRLYKTVSSVLFLPVCWWQSYLYIYSQSVIFYRLFQSGSRGAGAYLLQSMGKRRGTPWTGHQSIAGQPTNNQAYTHSYT
ncbi:hypothetical protein CHARACLAT_012926 [Characodon lateralis]|uniref:Uncharacterized protein n=1 Tax=Characodon lateralis TaxID=208331 RepID=A0ABU7DGK1_9TELE|nr:hypothetical protein [Characodon lateralis]